VLRFSPTAWGKLLYLRDLGPTEIGGLAVSAADDLLRVEDILVVRQRSTAVSVEFDDEGIADCFDRQIDAGLRPERFSRIWVHTHPDNSPRPSGLDEATFIRVFGQMEWAVMFILAKGGATYARLRFNVGPGSDLEICVTVDYSLPFAGSSWQDWSGEYAANLAEIDPWSGRLSAGAEQRSAPNRAGIDERDLLSRADVRFVRAVAVGGRAPCEQPVAGGPIVEPKPGR
jgi:hypothetical protein